MDHTGEALKNLKKKKMEKTMHEFKEGTLHSGHGPKVHDRKQAIAIAMSQARKEGK